MCVCVCKSAFHDIQHKGYMHNQNKSTGKKLK